MTTSHIMITSFPKYVKLVELAMVQMVGNMEDERCFSFMAFMKSKLHNRLTTQLLFLVWMFTQRFYIIHNSHMRSALNNGKLPTIATTMMGSM